jgi:LysM repeat protein
LFALFLLIFFALIAYYAYFQATDRIVPGVSAGGISLSGLTVEEATVQLEATWNLNATFTATDGVRSWNVLPGQFGLSIDSVQTAAQAIDIAHGQDFFSEVAQMSSAMTKGAHVEPVVVFDPERARKGLEDFAPQVVIPPLNASLKWENGQLTTTPSVQGFALDIDKTYTGLEYAPLQMLQQGVLPLHMSPVAPRISDASAALADAQKLLDSPFNITIYDPVTAEYIQWPVTRETLGSWLAIASDDIGIHVSLDPAKVAGFLSNQNASLGPGRWVDAQEASQMAADAVSQGSNVTLIARHDATTYTVQPGDTLIRVGWRTGMPYWRILNANPGLDPDKLSTGQVLAIPSKDENMPLPVVPGKRIVVSISEQHLWAYEWGQEVASYVIATGIDRSPTQPGIFQVQTHVDEAYASLWDLTMPNFLGIYESWPGFWNGFHGLPTLSNGQILWKGALGHPTSYGCIILDLPDGEWLYTWAEEGTVVEIRE